MSEELKLEPCPFCGNKRISVVEPVSETGKCFGTKSRVIHIFCNDCKIPGVLGSLERKDEAFAAWNRRAEPQWTTETPTEPGWYWMKHTLSEHLGSVRWLIYLYRSAWDGELDAICVPTQKGRVKYATHVTLKEMLKIKGIDDKPHQWLKIEEPEIPD